MLRKAFCRRPADWLDGQDRHKLLAAWLRAERGWFTTGYLLKAHPIRLLFLVEISVARNASWFLRPSPMPGVSVWFLSEVGWLGLAQRPFVGLLS